MRLEAREDGGDPCKLKEGVSATRQESRSPSPPRQWRQERDRPLRLVPRTGSTSRSREPLRANGDPETEGSRSPAERAAAVPAAGARVEGPNSEHTGYLSQLPAQRSPLPQTRGYYGLPGRAPVTSSARAGTGGGRARPLGKSRAGPPPPLRRRGRGRESPGELGGSLGLPRPPAHAS